MHQASAPGRMHILDRMSVILFLLLTSVVAGAILYVVLTSGFAFARSRGTRLVTCPESGEPAAVAFASWKAALAAPFKKREPELATCNRWPQRADCDRGCLAQVAESPDGCLLRGHVERWYGDRTCTICGRTFEALSATEHRPALLSSEGETLQWDEFAPERIPAVLAGHRPVCWNCHVVRTVARRRPDLVTVRPQHPDPQQLPG